MVNLIQFNDIEVRKCFDQATSNAKTVPIVTSSVRIVTSSIIWTIMLTNSQSVFVRTKARLLENCEKALYTLNSKAANILGLKKAYFLCKILKYVKNIR